MARPNKTGLDYFPMDVNTDFKFELIEAKHGLVGFAVVVKLYQQIYKAGYFTPWNEEMLLLFKKSVNLEIEKVAAIVDDCFLYSIFDRMLHDKYGILTSPGIQKRYLSACERRKQVELSRHYFLIDVNQFNVNIKWINDSINSVDEYVKCNSTQEQKLQKEKSSDLKDVPENYREVVVDWLTYKRSRRETYKSEKSISVFYNKLYEMSGGSPDVAKKIIDQSMANNWAGIFELKVNYASNRNNTQSERRKEEFLAEAAAISGRVN